MIKFCQREPRLPKNTRGTDYARRTIKALANSANQQYRNAIEVDGIYGHLYNRLTHGEKCTCQTTSRQILDSDGNMDQRMMDALLDDIQMSDYNGEELEIITIDGNKELPPDAPPQGTTFGAGGCAVCFNTGIVGGYQIYGGRRYVFAPQMDDMQLKKVTINYEDSPNTWRVQSGSKITIKKKIPRAYDIAQTAVAMCNKIVGNFTLTEKDGSYEFEFLEDSAITHIVIQVGSKSSLIPLNFDRVSVSFDAFDADKFNDVNVAIPPNIHLTNRSIFIDPVRSMWWRLLDINHQNDSFGTEYGYTANASVVRPYEIERLLWTDTKSKGFTSLFDRGLTCNVSS